MLFTRLIGIATLALAVASPAGCGGSGSTEPGAIVPPLGRYALSAGVPSGGLNPWQATGTLVLNYATADSIAGTMTASTTTQATFGPKVQLGFRNADAYYVVLNLVFSSDGHYIDSPNFRLRPVSGGLVCDRVGIATGAVGSCSISYLGR